jgi:hypothetical protein
MRSDWSAFRRSNRAAMLWLVPGLPLAMGIAAVVASLFAAELGLILFFVGLLWACVFAWLAFQVTRFACPRCKAAYFSHRDVPLIVGAFYRRCASCGLELYREA